MLVVLGVLMGVGGERLLVGHLVLHHSRRPSTGMRLLLLLPRRRLLLVLLLDRLLLLLVLHAPVLEPDLDLSFGKHQRSRKLDTSPPRQVLVVMELLFQFQRLVARVRLTTSFFLCKLPSSSIVSLILS